jgi:hypothetical protein
MLARLGAVALAVSTAIGVAPHAVGGAGDGSCAVVWGSLAKVDANMSTAHLVNIRAGRHECFDRIVFDIDGPAGGYAVRYRAHVTHIATGEPIALRGGAFLELIVRVPAHDDDGQSTYPRAGRRHLVNVRGFSTFRQAAWAGSQEGVTAVGLGVRARLPFRVFVLAGPGAGSRIVVDVAHHW